MEFLKITRVNNVVITRRKVKSEGTLHLTTHHLIYTFNKREIWVCYPVLAQVIHLPDQKTLKLNCKDFQFLSFQFATHQQCQDVYDSVFRLTVVPRIESLYAFNYQPNQLEACLNSWNLYDPVKEFQRQGLTFDQNAEGGSKANWRITDLNISYSLCKSYPSNLVIPKTISDTVLKHAAKFRSKERIPSLTYYYKPLGNTITRCSQPLTGLKQSRSIQDERLVLEIFRSSELKNSPSNDLIVDCRPQTNAMAQTALGAGSEIMDNYPNSSKIFLGIDNIHAMRESLQKVCEILQDYSKPLSKEALLNTKWLKYIAIIMESLEKLTKHFIFNKANLLIHCSDGWDRTSQIASLLEICIDPYYRTLDGFITLIEKDWLSFGYRFNERSAHTSNLSVFTTEKINDDENISGNGAKKAFKSVTLQIKKLRQMDLTSPIFHQFLDVVYQLQRQFPEKFEFNERFLRRLVYHTYSCQYGTFLTDNEFDRLNIKDKTRSVWDYFLSRHDEFVSKDFEPPTGEEGEETYIIPNFKDFKWWWQLYGRVDEDMNGNEDENSANSNLELSNVLGSTLYPSSSSSQSPSPFKAKQSTSASPLIENDSELRDLSSLSAKNNAIPTHNHYKLDQSGSSKDLTSSFEKMDVVR